MFNRLINRLKNFDFSGLLHHEENIGGLAIGQNKIVLIYLNKKTLFETDKKKFEAIFQKEILLPEGIIEKGVLKNRSQFLNNLKIILNKTKLPSKSVIVSLPPTVAQPFIFEFFPNLSQKELNDAISLIIDSSLPLARTKIYVDWEEIKDEDSRKKKILLAMGIKELIDPYLEEIKNAGFAPVAVETHSWNLPRVIDFKNKPILTVDIETTQSIITAYFNNAPVFQFEAPRETDISAFDEKLTDFIERILYFIKSDNSFGFDIENFLVIGEENDRRKLKITMEKRIIGDDGRAISVNDMDLPKIPVFSYGTALRGFLPRSEDTIASLMPIGTELAYERQRLISFLDFFQKLTVALGGFFLILFLGTILLLNIIFNINAKTFVEYRAIIPEGLSTIKTAVNAVNNRTEQLSQIFKITPKWENLFVEIDKLVNSGLTINVIEISSDQTVNVSGFARDRNSLLQLKSTLENSEIFASPPIPLSVLIGKENIPFSLKLQLKNKNLIYQ